VATDALRWIAEAEVTHGQQSFVELKLWAEQLTELAEKRPPPGRDLSGQYEWNDDYRDMKIPAETINRMLDALPDRWIAAHPEHRLEQRKEESREAQGVVAANGPHVGLPRPVGDRDPEFATGLVRSGWLLRWGADLFVRMDSGLMPRPRLQAGPPERRRGRVRRRPSAARDWAVRPGTSVSPYL
jgi:hypothetical protein